MVVVLHLIALAMVLSGAASISYGSGIIALERGWTMVIAGTVAATGGCVLLGVAAVAARLGMVLGELRRILDYSPGFQTESASARADERDAKPLESRAAPDVPVARWPEPVVAAEPSPRHAERVDDVPPSAGKAASPRPRPAATGIAAAEPAAKASELSAVPIMTPSTGREPSIFETLAIKPLPAGAAEPHRSETDRDKEAAPAPRGVAADFAQGQTSGEDSGQIFPESPSDRDLLDATASFPEAPEVETQAAPSPGRHEGAQTGPDPASAPGHPANEVVGSYSSGDNSYVMYADGSIQAHTPTGQHRFASLDDLKSFLANEPENGRQPPVPQASAEAEETARSAKA